MITRKAFARTRSTWPNTVAAISGQLNKVGVSQRQVTEEGDDERGRIGVAFVWGDGEQRRAVRVIVGYDRREGATKVMAGRALFWFLKNKFDSIEYGIEEFDVAFMPHLITEGGFTLAERPAYIDQLLVDPDIRMLPPGGA